MNDLISRQAVRDLMYHNQVYHNESILTEYDLDSIPSVETAPIIHWISIDEKLPEKCKTILVYVQKTNSIWTGCYLDDTFYKWELYGYGSSNLVTHWMELPQPPNNNDNEVVE